MASAKKRSTTKNRATTAPVNRARKPSKSYAPLMAQKRREYFKKLPKELRPQRAKLISAPKLFAKSIRNLLNDWKLFAVILAVYAGVYVVLVGGLSGANLQSAKAGLEAGGMSNAKITTQLFSNLLTSGNSSNSPAGVYQTFLMLIISLVLIWALRQRLAGQKIRARDAFYKGTTPLIPFLLILIVIGLELLPMVFGGALFNAMVSNGIAKGPFEVMLLALLLVGLIALSLYWLSTSVVALYAAAQPDTAPMHALRSARQLVRYRRYEVLRKLLFLPLVLFVLSVVILMPIARYATSIASLVFFMLTVIMIAVFHSYMYALYQELNE